MLINIALLLLSTFPTTIDQDQAILGGELPDDERLAIRFRMEKKRILANVISKLSSRLQPGRH